MLNKLHLFSEIMDKVFVILSREQKKKSLLAFIAMIISSILELLGVTAIVPFITAIMNSDALMRNQYIRFVMKILGVRIENSSTVLILLGILLILVYAIKNLSLIWSRYIQNVYQVNLQKDVSVMMMKAYLNHPYEFFANTNSAEILRGVEADVNGFANIIGVLFTCIAELITAILIIAFVLTTDFITSIALVVVVILCVVIIIYGCKNIMKRTGIRYRELIAKKSKCAFQIINGVKEVFVMRRERFFLKEYERIYEESCVATKLYMLVIAIPERVIEMMVVCGIVAIVCIRIMQGYTAEAYIPQLGAVAIACFRLLPSLNKLTGGISQILFLKPNLDAVYNNVIEAREYIAGNDKNLEVDSFVDFESLSFKREIEINDITWRYMNGEKNILEHLSLKICRGESIALIGESGAGKSTLADIIMGLLHPKQGTIRVDGETIDQNDFRWNRMIGYVPQNVYLIDDTIRNNIAFGIPEQEIQDEAVWKALKQAKLDEYIRKLPLGLDTVVGERGIKFSGGQRQRIAIARTMYYDPEILVLDEATSALDNETEREVMESIDSLQGEKTLIIIAHRLSTIQKCDKIYEVINGGIVERNKADVLCQI